MINSHQYLAFMIFKGFRVNHFQPYRKFAWCSSRKRLGVSCSELNLHTKEEMSEDKVFLVEFFKQNERYSNFSHRYQNKLNLPVHYYRQGFFPNFCESKDISTSCLLRFFLAMTTPGNVLSKTTKTLLTMSLASMIRAVPSGSVHQRKSCSWKKTDCSKSPRVLLPLLAIRGRCL